MADPRGQPQYPPNDPVADEIEAIETSRAQPQHPPNDPVADEIEAIETSRAQPQHPPNDPVADEIEAIETSQAQPQQPPNDSVAAENDSQPIDPKLLRAIANGDLISVKSILGIGEPTDIESTGVTNNGGNSVVRGVTCGVENNALHVVAEVVIEKTSIHQQILLIIFFVLLMGNCIEFIFLMEISIFCIFPMGIVIIMTCIYCYCIFIKDYIYEKAKRTWWLEWVLSFYKRRIYMEIADIIYYQDPTLLYARNCAEETPLHCAANAGNHLMANKLVEFAQREGQQNLQQLLRARNKVGETALHVAARSSYRGIVDLLLGKDKTVACLEDHNGISPLYLAVTTGCLYVVQKLIAAPDSPAAPAADPPSDPPAADPPSDPSAAPAAAPPAAPAAAPPAAPAAGPPAAPAAGPPAAPAAGPPAAPAADSLAVDPPAADPPAAPAADPPAAPAADPPAAPAAAPPAADPPSDPPAAPAADPPAEDPLAADTPAAPAADLPSYSGPNEQNVLHAAVMRNEGEIMWAILEWNPSLAAKTDKEGNTPLHYAALIGNIYAARKLLLEDTTTRSAYKANKSGSFPMHLAAEAGKIKVIKELLSMCPDVGELLDKEKRNFLHIAVQKKRIEVITLIDHVRINAKVINAQDKDGNTPLHLAVISSDSEIFEILFRNKIVNPNIRNGVGQTPLDISASLQNHQPKYPLFPRNLIYYALLDSGAFQNPCQPGISKNDVEVDIEKELADCDNKSKSLATGAVLIASATFAGIFTVSKVYNDTSDPNPLSIIFAFPVFVLVDMLAFICSIASTIWLLYGSLSDSLPKYHKICFGFCTPLLFIALHLFILAFGLGSYIAIAPFNDPLAVVVLLSSVFFWLYTILNRPRFFPKVVFYFR